ncbi:MAG: SUMF1/EgtB/PvdO family nonheme iron enzyme [Bacteroidales bacterium]|nr:SUMF1/EgtB/PvdO family nonheme iron enzyme [Bacteroidales bacterium]
MKAKTLCCGALALGFLLSGCNPKEVHFDSDKIYFFRLETDLYLHVGDEAVLQPSDEPEGRHNTWLSEDESVATVDWQGRVTARSVGETLVTVVNDYPYQDLSGLVYIHVVPDEVYVFRNSCLRMVDVEGGTFTMGREGYSVNPAREVTVGDFRIADQEVTEALWTAVMEGRYIALEQSVHHAQTGTYDQFASFLERLREQTGLPFRFPTEAEWEWAARGGKYSHGYPYAGSENLDGCGWYKDNWPGDHTLYHNNSVMHPLAALAPNELGLYDMSGGASEWVSDPFPDIQVDGKDLDILVGTYEHFVPGAPFTKGGSVLSPAAWCRVWARECAPHELAPGPRGLRLAL